MRCYWYMATLLTIAAPLELSAETRISWPTALLGRIWKSEAYRLDGDGRPDILLAGRGSENVVWYRNVHD